MKSKAFTPHHFNKMKKLKPKTTAFKSGGGFTLVEVLVALFVLTTAIVAGLNAVNSGLSSTQNAKSKLIAANLVQEGIEVVRNIRDTTWLEQRTNPELLWDDVLPPGDWEVTYQSQSLSPYLERYLKINANGFYNYTIGTDTKFKRKITIQKITNDQLRIISKIEWEERGKSYNLTAVGDLYNWLRGSAAVSPPPSPPPTPPPIPLCPVCQQFDSYGQCIPTFNTNWGAGLYGCSGTDQRCYQGSCVTCGGTLASDNCSGCAGQGETACWHLGALGASCESNCASYGGCVAANWNDDTNCTVGKTFKSCSYYGGVPSGSSPFIASSPLWCAFRSGPGQYCNSTTGAGTWRMCVCNY